MKRFFILIVISFIFAVSCSDGGENSTLSDNNGKEGYNCKEDKTCEEGLFCNRNNICEKEKEEQRGGLNQKCNIDGSCNDNLICADDKCVEDNRGQKDYPCKEDGSCNEGLVCKNNVCIDDNFREHEGEKGYSCKENDICNEGLVCIEGICEEEDDLRGTQGHECREDKTCDYNLFCNLENICEETDVVDFGKEGKPCIKVGDKKCLEDYLYCNEYDLCVRIEGERGDEGMPCYEDGSCNEGLMCGIEGLCLNESDFHSGDMAQECRTNNEVTDFCYSGLTCNIYGECELDCSDGNDELCANDGSFDFSPYVGKYKLLKFYENNDCNNNNFINKEQNYNYFELVLENYYGFKYLGYHTCSSVSECSSTEKSYYRIVDFDGKELMEFAYENEDGSCSYVSVDTYARISGNKVRLRYVFNEARLQNSSDECSSLNVHNHYGEMTCSKIRIIDGIRE